jgi:glutathione S-transferase
MSQLTIYGFSPSTYTKSALMVAAECGVPVDLRPLEFQQASHFQLHPYGKMPILQHNGETLFETLAITSYIDRVFGASGLTPTEATDYSRMLQWGSAAVDYLYPALVGDLHADEPASEAVTKAAEQLKLIDAQLGSRAYLAGEKVSLADFIVLPMVEFAAAKLDTGKFRSLRNLTRWQKLMSARPSVSKAA